MVFAGSRLGSFALFALGALALQACEAAADRQQEAARQQFAAFQEALFQRDRSALRGLLCSDAHPAIDAMCAKNYAGRQPLEVLRVEQRNYEFLVHVRDPNENGRESHFVMTVENGAMRVDLRETVRNNSVTKREFLAEERFVPQKLTREQIEHARVTHAQPNATPPAKK